MECSPHHNFIAHGVLTHNCDSPDSLTRQRAWVATTEALVERISWLHRAGQIILFTGGEPLLQPIYLVVEEVNVLGIGPVHLETNGTICAPNIFNWITVSPKKAARYDVHIWTITLAHEVKWLVKDEGDVERLKQFLADWEDQFTGVVSIQPISCDPGATDIAYNAALNNGWRLSLQTHKLIGER
jgi:7-carboxy-7-deazaguanine synthase